jgi:diguanylate cyclase (GGDEF)-like protein
MASPIPDGSRQASPAPARHGLVVPYAWLGTVLLAQTALATFLLRETEWGVASLVSLGLSAIASGLVLLRVFEARIGRVQRKLESILSELEHARPTIGSHSRDAGVLELIDSIAAHTSTLISMTVEREKQILKAALQDPVTGLGNRTVLSHRIDIAIKAQAESGARFCIAIVEIGRFKEIAEMLGTGQMNDGVNQIARRLRRELRKDDTIVRLGDERFALLVRGDRDVAEPVLNRIAESGRQPLMIGGELVDIKVHIGAAMYPDDANSETNLLLHAQLAAERRVEGPGQVHVLRRADVHAPARRGAWRSLYLVGAGSGGWVVGRVRLSEDPEPRTQPLPAKMASEVSRAAKRNCALADEELHSNATLLTRDLSLRRC